MSNPEPQKLTYNTLIAQAEALETSPIAQCNPEIRKLVEDYKMNLGNLLSSQIALYTGPSEDAPTEDRPIQSRFTLETIGMLTAILHQQIRDLVHLSSGSIQEPETSPSPASKTESAHIPPESTDNANPERIRILGSLGADYSENRIFLRKMGLVRETYEFLMSYNGDYDVDKCEGHLGVPLAVGGYNLPSWKEITAGLEIADFQAFLHMEKMGMQPRLQMTPLAYGLNERLKVLAECLSEQSIDIWNADLELTKGPAPGIEPFYWLSLGNMQYGSTSTSIVNNQGEYLVNSHGLRKSQWIRKQHGWLVEIIPTNLAAGIIHVGDQTGPSRPLQEYQELAGRLPNENLSTDTLESSLVSQIWATDRSYGPALIRDWGSPVTLCFPGSSYAQGTSIPICQLKGNQAQYGLVNWQAAESLTRCTPATIQNHALHLSHRYLRRLQPKYQQESQ